MLWSTHMYRSAVQPRSHVGTDEDHPGNNDITLENHLHSGAASSVVIVDGIGQFPYTMLSCLHCCIGLRVRKTLQWEQEATGYTTPLVGDDFLQSRCARKGRSHITSPTLASSNGIDHMRFNAPYLHDVITCVSRQERPSSSSHAAT